MIFKSFWVDLGIIFRMNLGSFGYDFEDYFEWFIYIYIYYARGGGWNAGRPQIQIDMKIHEFSKSGKKTGLSKWIFKIIKIIFKIIPNMILKIPISTPPRVYIRSHSKVIFKIKNPFKIVWKISSLYNFYEYMSSCVVRGDCPTGPRTTPCHNWRIVVLSLGWPRVWGPFVLPPACQGPGTHILV